VYIRISRPATPHALAPTGPPPRPHPASPPGNARLPPGPCLAHPKLGPRPFAGDSEESRRRPRRAPALPAWQASHGREHLRRRPARRGRPCCQRTKLSDSGPTGDSPPPGTRGTCFSHGDTQELLATCNRGARITSSRNLHHRVETQYLAPENQHFVAKLKDSCETIRRSLRKLKVQGGTQSFAAQLTSSCRTQSSKPATPLAEIKPSWRN
jgi:hypothetical protein